MQGAEKAKPLLGRSLLIFDDSLRRVEDHPYEYVRSVAELHLGLGARVTVICHRDIQAREAFEKMGVELLPIVDRAMSAGEYPMSGLRQELTAALRQNFSYARLLRRHLKERRYDALLVPDSTLYDSFAWSLLRATGALRDVERLVIVLRYHFGQYEGAPYLPLKTALWRRALRFHRDAIARGRTVIVSDSAQLAQDYHRATGVEAGVIPHPMTVPEIDAKPRQAASETIAFGMLGSARHDKGGDLFQAAIKQLLEQGKAESMRFAMQWHRPLMLPGGGECPRDPLLEASDRVHFFDKPLSSEEYAAAFVDIDCMVLPYRRELYGSSISGVAVEAACAGTPIICTADTWLSHFMERYGAGIAVPSGDIDALVAAMIEMRDNFAHYSAAARVAAPKARSSHGAEAYARVLWGAERFEVAA